VYPFAHLVDDCVQRRASLLDFGGNSNIAFTVTTGKYRYVVSMSFE
jgi:hypothetical protein